MHFIGLYAKNLKKTKMAHPDPHRRGFKRKDEEARHFGTRVAQWDIRNLIAFFHTTTILFARFLEVYLT